MTNEWRMDDEHKKNNDKNDKQPNGWTMTSNECSELNAWWNIMNNLWVSDKQQWNHEWSVMNGAIWKWMDDKQVDDEK